MNAHRPNQCEPESEEDRAARIKDVILDVLQRRNLGEIIVDETIIAEYAKLMPELGEELRIAAELQADADLQNVHESQRTSLEQKPRALRIRCPHCHKPIEILGEMAFSDLTCSGCGSQFSLVGKDDSPPPCRLKQLAQFELVERLGMGSFGTVWKALDTELDRIVAIKIPREGKLDSRESEQFLREARSAAQLNHPNIITVHEAGREDDIVYIVSDFVRGTSLADWLNGQQPTFREAAALCAKVADALQHAHDNGVVHRDLKPHNIMLDNDGQPHLTDFGLARRDTGEITMTVDGHVLGTPAYMSPEQARGEAHQADHRTDIYSLGVILFELLTGELPFRGSARMLVHQVLNEDAPVLRKLNSSVPRDLETICLKCLEKDPDRRYASAHDIADELRKYLDGQPIEARRITQVERGWRWCKRNAVVATLVGILAAVLLIAGVAGPIVAIRQTQLAVQNAELAEKESSARQEVAAQAKEMERRIYLSHLSNADAAVLRGDLLEAQTSLDACPLEQRGWEWRYLIQRIRATIPLVLPGSEQALFSADGKHLTAIGTERTLDNHLVKTWNLETGLEVGTPLKYDSSLYSLALSPDEARIAAGDVDGHLIVWDVPSRNKLVEKRIHKERFDGLDFSPDGRLIASVSFDGTLVVTDAASGQVRFTHAAESHLLGVMFSPNGRWLATGLSGAREPAMLIDINTGQVVMTFPGGGDMVPTFHPDGERIATANVDGTIKIWSWDGQRLELLKSWPATDEKIRCLDFNSDGTLLAATDTANAIRVWDVATAQTVATLHSRETVWWLAFSPDSQSIALFSLTDGISLWHYREHKDVLAVKPLSGPAGVRFSPDGKSILTSRVIEFFGLIFYAERTEPAALLDPVTGDVMATLDQPVYAASWSADGRKIVAIFATQDELRTFDAGTCAFLRTFAADGQVQAVRFGPHDDRLLCTFSDGTISVIDCTSGEIEQKHATVPNKPTSMRTTAVAFSRDTEHVALGIYPEDYRVDVWNVGNMRLVSSHATPGLLAHSLAFSKNGSRVYVGNSKSQLVAFGSLSGHPIQIFQGHRNRVTAVAIAPEESEIVSGDSSGRVIIWDVESGQRLVTLTDGDQGITSLDWSPDGRQIVAGKEDGTVQIWTLPRSQ